MNKALLIGIVLLALMPIFTSAATINAASCSYEHVSSAIGSAQPGDTVIVPEGRCVWSNQLPITKGIIIKGAGIGKTVITSAYKAPNTFSTYSSTSLVYYNPGIPADNHVFRLTGFTFDCNGTSGFMFIRTDGVPFARNFRVDHNEIKNTNPANVSGWRAIYVWAHVAGVIDNNIFTGGSNVMGGYGRNTVSWSNHIFSFGSADQLYFEDNYVECKSTPHSGGGGGRYCARYNEYHSTGSLYPWYDAHGNQPGANPSHMGVEIYGNTLTVGNGYGGVGIFDQRGGMGLAYNNNVITTGSVSAKAREEFNDATHVPFEGPAGQPLHVSDSYYWGNTKNGLTLVNPYIGSKPRWDTVDYSNSSWNYYFEPLAYKGLVPRWDVHAWRQVDSFDGSTGMGVGLLANRPKSCILEGAGYWATDKQSLYRCKNRAWELYYTPYTYPHPLRTDCVSYPGLCDSGSSFVASLCTAADWTSSDGVCQSTNTLVRSWTKVNSNCQGGVTHSSVEYIPCTYSSYSSSGSVTNLASCEQSVVQNAVNNAKVGDTIVVPAGTCTWNNQLVINKPLSIIGAGIDKTIIKSGYNAWDYYVASNVVTVALVYYNPGVPDENHFFKFSGFTIDCQNRADGIFLKHSTSVGTEVAKNVRIHHNKIKNTNATGRMFIFQGHFYGVVDNNIGENVKGIASILGKSSLTWTHFTYKYDTPDQIYFEDNHISGDIFYVVGVSGAGGRWCSRYNVAQANTTRFVGFHDTHGNQKPDASWHANMGAISYGNVQYSPDGYISGRFGDHRGGMFMSYDNKIYVQSKGTISGVQVREEYNDGNHAPYKGPGGQPLHVSDSYIWNNIRVMGGVESRADPFIRSTVDYSNKSAPYYFEPLAYKGVVPRKDVHFWQQVDSFDGSTGMGVGLLANRPKSCILEGAGYWATDQKKLYRCKNRAWELYYTPYTYPHPLRTDCVSYPGLCDSGSSFVASLCTAADWSFSDGVCQSTNTLVRSWTKVNANCQGGVTHSSVEYIPCTYSANLGCSGSCLVNSCGYYAGCSPVVGTCTYGYCCEGACSSPSLCTAADWTSSDGACQSSNTMLRSWVRVNNACRGGVLHPESENVECTYTPPPSGAVIQAESGEITPPFQTSTSGDVTSVFQPSQTGLSSGGKAVYDFEITSPDTYVVKAVVNAIDEGSNSFFANIDADPVDSTMIWDINSYTRGFQVRYLSWRGNAETGAQYDPKVFTLSAGAHKLIIIGREANTHFDKFEIVPYYASSSTGLEPGSGISGDANGDGVISLDDLLAIIYYLQHRGRSYQPLDMGSFDVNKDGMVNVRDLVYVARQLQFSGRLR